MRAFFFLASDVDETVVRVQSKNRPSHFWAVDEGVEGYLMRQEELFRVIRPGLSGAFQGGVSFESVMRPGYYICRKDGEVFVLDAVSHGAPLDEFNAEATWFVRNDLYYDGYTSFESVVTPGHFIRHINRKLKVTAIDESDSGDKNDASFLMTDINSGDNIMIDENSWRWQAFPYDVLITPLVLFLFIVFCMGSEA